MKLEEFAEKTAPYRGYIYLTLVSLTLLVRAAEKDREGVLLCMMVLPLCLIYIVRHNKKN